MKIKYLSFLSFLLLFAVLSAGCSNDGETDNSEKYPIEIPFEEYTLDVTGCQWTNLKYDGTVTIIRTRDEFESYISCAEGNYPSIDFAKKTLLVASGINDCGISFSTAKMLMQLEHKHYGFTVEITLNGADAEETWQLAILTDKIDADSMQDLIVTIDDSKIDYPVKIPVEEYSIIGIDVQLQITSLIWGKALIINSNEEMENYFINYPEIDFSKHSLLLTADLSPSQPLKLIEADFFKNNINEYILNLTIFNGLLASSLLWRFAFLVPKIQGEAIVTLNITYCPFCIELL